MAKEKQKLKKRKAREQRAKDRVLKRRTEIRAKAKEDREERKLEKRIKKLKKAMDEFDYYDEELYRQMPPEVLTQLEHNVKVLQAVEQEYEQTEQARLERQQALEDQGYFTLEDKMEALTAAQNAAKIEAGEAEDVGMGGVAECRMTVNEPTETTEDVAEVSVTKSKPTEISTDS